MSLIHQKKKKHRRRKAKPHADDDDADHTTGDTSSESEQQQQERPNASLMRLTDEQRTTAIPRLRAVTFQNDTVVIASDAIVLMRCA